MPSGSLWGWRKGLGPLLSFVGSPRLVGIQLLLNQGPLFFTSVHLPSRAGCMELFKEAMDQLGVAIKLLPPGCKVVVIGDFNVTCKSCSVTNEQGSIFSRYLHTWEFVSSHLHLSPSCITHTHESDAHSTLSTIDHIICPTHYLSDFCSSVVLDLNTSDHLPVVAVLYYSPSSSSSQPPPTLPNKVLSVHCNWNKCSAEYIQHFCTTPLQNSLQSLSLTFPTQDMLLLQPLVLDNVFHSFIQCLKESAMNLRISSTRFLNGLSHFMRPSEIARLYTGNGLQWGAPNHFLI